MGPWNIPYVLLYDSVNFVLEYTETCWFNCNFSFLFFFFFWLFSYIRLQSLWAIATWSCRSKDSEELQMLHCPGVLLSIAEVCYHCADWHESNDCLHWIQVQEADKGCNQNPGLCFTSYCKISNRRFIDLGNARQLIRCLLWVLHLLVECRLTYVVTDITHITEVCKRLLLLPNVVGGDVLRGKSFETLKWFVFIVHVFTVWNRFHLALCMNVFCIESGCKGNRSFKRSQRQARKESRGAYMALAVWEAIEGNPFDKIRVIHWYWFTTLSSTPLSLLVEYRLS